MESGTMKLSLAAIAVFLALVSSARGDDDSWMMEDNGYVFGKRYQSETGENHKGFAEAPTWEKAAENPPLSARKALERGDKLAGDLVEQPAGWHRELECLSLVPIAKKWIWQPKYIWRSATGRRAGDRSVPFMILMDGTAVAPRVTDTPDLSVELDAEPPLPKNRGLRWYGHSGIKEYVYRLPNDIVNRSPAWLPREPNPPVSARKAIKLANEFAERAPHR